MVTKRPKALDDGFSGLPVADAREHLFLECLETAVEKVFLGGEVVEHGRLGDLRLTGDLGHRNGVESPLGEQPPRGVGDQLSGALLLALSETQLGGHAAIVAGTLDTPYS